MPRLRREDILCEIHRIWGVLGWRSWGIMYPDVANME